jgi:penicillin-binding protein 2A
MATKAKQRGKKKKKKLLMFAVSFTVFLIFSVIGGYFVLLYAGEKMIETQIQKLEALKSEPTVIYDKDGNEITKLLREKNTKYVPLTQMPDHLINAFIATEDRRFFEHKGVDMFRIGGAIINDIRKGSLAEGGSTITQQLARRVFLSLEQTFWRKTKEVCIAMALERRYSKDQILEMYLNQIYFGEGAYGVGDAAQRYFDKDVTQLDLHESAMLAAIPKAPTTYSPFNNPDKAKLRRDTVLRLMSEQGFITQEQKVTAQAKPVPEETDETKAGGGLKKGYRAFYDYVIREAEAKYDVTEEDLYRGGWKIYTTFNPKMQDAMVEAYDNPANFPKPGPQRAVESAMIVIDAKTGGIAAMMGGRDYKPKGFNLATDMQRQPGSSFKPLAVYAPAIDSDSKWGPNSSLSNKRQDFNGYEPRNYNNKYSDSVSMTRAVIDSLNVPAVWLLNEIGIGTSLKYLEKFGINLSEKDRNLAIALGGLDKGTSPLKMAQAYTAFPNSGVVSEAHVIERMENERGGIQKVYQPKQEQVIKPETAWKVHTMLERAVKEGTGRNARISGRHVAGKTGTTQSLIGNSSVNKDAWFVGYTPEYVGAVWMGYDKEDAQHLMHEGSSLTAKMFATVLKKGLKGEPVRDFEPPAGMKRYEEEKKEAASVHLSADLTLEGNSLKVILTWSGGDDDYTYDVYRVSPDNPDNRQLIAAGVKDNRHVDTLDSPVMYKYVVVPHDADGRELEPSNIAEINTKQLEQLLQEGEHHDDSGTHEDDGTVEGGNGQYPSTGTEGQDGTGQPADDQPSGGETPVIPPDIVQPNGQQLPPNGIELPPPPPEDAGGGRHSPGNGRNR